jgi:5-methylcytosine-specific restriction protein A
MARREFTKKIKRERWKLAGGKCEECGHVFPADMHGEKVPHYDHVNPTGWAGGDGSLENCKLLCHVCHKLKTSAEAPQKAKKDRIQDKALGTATPKAKIKSAGFKEAAPQKKATTPPEKAMRGLTNIQRRFRWE